MIRHIGTLQGIIPILCTPFTPDGALDLESFAVQVEAVVTGGAHGVGVLALASEGYKLNDTERTQIIRVAVEHARGRVPVVVAADHAGSAAAVARCREAQTLGADAVMLLPPYLIPPSADALLRHYVAAARAVALPLVVQDSPAVTRVAIAPALLARLREDAPNACYVKIEGAPVGERISRTVAAGGIGVLCGWGGLGLPEAMRRGARGCMPGAEAVADLVALWDAGRRGDEATVRAIYHALLPWLTFVGQSLDHFVHGTKFVLAERGVIRHATLREPTDPLDQIGYDEMHHAYTAWQAMREGWANGSNR